MSEPAHDPVNHPSHYTFGKIEVIEAIEDWKLGFNLGNAVKYIARAEHKGRALEDLRKAKWYLEREIANRGESCICGHPRIAHDEDGICTHLISKMGEAEEMCPCNKFESF